MTAVMMPMIEPASSDEPASGLFEPGTRSDGFGMMVPGTDGVGSDWDGTTGVTQDGDIPWIWLCNVDHLYFVRDGLQVAEQKIHPHGHGWSIVNNVDQWSWEG